VRPNQFLFDAGQRNVEQLAHQQADFLAILVLRHVEGRFLGGFGFFVFLIGVDALHVGRVEFVGVHTEKIGECVIERVNIGEEDLQDLQGQLADLLLAVHGALDQTTEGAVEQRLHGLY